MPTIDHNLLRKLAYDVYRAMGAPDAQARLVSDYQVETNLIGHDSHGCIAVPRFVNDIRSGKLVPDAEPEILHRDGPTALMNGHRSFGHYSASNATDLAITVAQELGVGTVGIQNCNHVGALWGYVERIVNANMVALIICSAGPRGGMVVPFGGIKPALGGNPIAFGAPSKTMSPLICDISTAAVAGGKVLIALQNGDPIPDDWALNADGKPTTDPGEYMTLELETIGAMRGFGGHKGYAIALFAEILGAMLTGYGAAYRDEYIEGNGTFGIAIAIARFVDVDIFRAQVDAYFQAVKSVPCSEGTNEILIPGELETRAREERQRDGIPFLDGTWQTISDTAAELGVDIQAE